MSISWQTGEPPCGEELLIEYRECDNECYPKLRAVAIHVKDTNDYVIWTWRRYNVTILRWSTIDDDRAAMAMGALEKYIDSHPDDSVDLSKIDGKYVAVLSDSCGYLYADSKREGTSIIEAIEKLTATDQQTKGASDGQA